MKRAEDGLNLDTPSIDNTGKLNRGCKNALICQEDKEIVLKLSVNLTFFMSATHFFLVSNKEFLLKEKRVYETIMATGTTSPSHAPPIKSQFSTNYLGVWEW